MSDCSFERSPPTKRKSTSDQQVKEETSPPNVGHDKIKKTETPKKTPNKKTPTKKTPTEKKSLKSNEKAKAKKVTPKKSPSKTESKSSSEVKVEEDDEKSETSTAMAKEEKPKINPFFTKQKDIKLQSAEDTSNGSSYNPGKANYHPVKDCFWKYGEK